MLAGNFDDLLQGFFTVNRPGGVVGIADQQEARGLPEEGGPERFEREGEISSLVRDGLNRHPLHLGAGGVIAKGGTGGEQAIAAGSIGVEYRMQGRIHTVEQTHVLGGQGMGKASSAAGAIGEVGGHRLPETVVLGIDGVVIGGADAGSA